VGGSAVDTESFIENVVVFGSLLIALRQPPRRVAPPAGFFGLYADYRRVLRRRLAMVDPGPRPRLFETYERLQGPPRRAGRSPDGRKRATSEVFSLKITSSGS
jgi:hypothetical protein